MTRINFNKKTLFLFTHLVVMSLQANNEKFVLITSLYNEKNHARIEEYMQCIEKNLAHPLIAKIHVLYDAGKNHSDDSVILNFLQSKNIEISTISGRPTFQHCFDLANTQYPSCPIILSNADIYFNETLQLLTAYDLENKFLALTRWNVQNDGTLKQLMISSGRRKTVLQPNHGSQDTWIFTTPLKSLTNANIPLGTWFCDGRIAYQAKQAGLQVTNPCQSIQCCHLHLSGIRNYKKKRPAGLTSKTPWCFLDLYP